jgi:hypothetical protein
VGVSGWGWDVSTGRPSCVPGGSYQRVGGWMLAMCMCGTAVVILVAHQGWLPQGRAWHAQAATKGQPTSLPACATTARFRSTCPSALTCFNLLLLSHLQSPAAAVAVVTCVML